ncbi:DUF3951 domain-containing protein [Bacillus swezeyi]|uniref:DUF3951 domain-containing protein n=1 Tax=Bacillus swezeyi TaxID=1925020 RepID=UPI003F8A6F33
MLLLLSLLLPLSIPVIITACAYNIFIRKKTIQNHYTPFDYIAGQTSKEFYEEKKEEEARDDDESGEGK